MTEQEYKDYYADLLILQYKTKTNARAHIQALVKSAYANGVFNQVMDGFNIDTAIGKQLDILGKYIGLTRNVKTILSDSGTTVLADNDYRVLLKFKLLTNISFSSTSDIQNALYGFFGNNIRVYDDRDMTYEYWISTEYEDLLGVLIAENLLPLPMGVGYKIIVVDDDILKFYGYYAANGINNNPNGFSTCTDGFRGRFLRTDDNYLSEE